MPSSTDQELSQLVQQAIAEFISPVAVLSINKENGTVSGQFRSGMQTFNYKINANGVAYKPAGAAPTTKKDSEYLLAYANELDRLDARKSGGGDWIAAATENKGGLHRHLGIPEGKKIPHATLEKAAKRPGVVGKEARLAETLERMHHDDDHAVLGLNAKSKPTMAMLDSAYAKARMAAHPSAGGSHEQLRRVHDAYNNLKRQYGKEAA